MWPLTQFVPSANSLSSSSPPLRLSQLILSPSVPYTTAGARSRLSSHHRPPLTFQAGPTHLETWPAIVVALSKL
ncbi:hypothetical protein PanWU01x14_038420 [Parasponia andersonii]|uniref:Uncharacterized protein n=1 Tax=Parasponia andersonii TaxID=3476 RepID=A0A2P5DRI8_PARAD|nr:hypothetical protein PanWU01x14_038420 [Parasponia andersonii]